VTPRLRVGLLWYVFNGRSPKRTASASFSEEKARFFNANSDHKPCFHVTQCTGADRKTRAGCRREFVRILATGPAMFYGRPRRSSKHIFPTRPIPRGRIFGLRIWPCLRNGLTTTRHLSRNSQYSRPRTTSTWAATVRQRRTQSSAAATRTLHLNSCGRNFRNSRLWFRSNKLLWPTPTEGCHETVFDRRQDKRRCREGRTGLPGGLQARPNCARSLGRAWMTRPTIVVGQVCNLPQPAKTRKKWQVSNLPHVQIGLLSGASREASGDAVVPRIHGPVAYASRLNQAFCKTSGVPTRLRTRLTCR
jgi:hypothetical protein